MIILKKPTPNFEKGRDGYKPEGIVIHVMEGTLEGTDSHFSKKASKVSAHYSVGRNGEVHQYVADEDTAWHAGRVSNPKPNARNLTRINPNTLTIGIEHEGFATTPWSPAMYTTSVRLCAGLCIKWNIPADREHIVGHREIYDKKTCPGLWVDLDAYVADVRLAIEEAKNPGVAKAIPDFPVLHLKNPPWMRGTAVETLQMLLNISPTDGIFGPQTREAVVHFQKSRREYGLRQDGVVDENTWKLLIST